MRRIRPLLCWGTRLPRTPANPEGGQTMRRFRKTLLLVAAAGLLALLAWSARGPFGYLAANRWRRQLSEAPAGRAEALAAQLARLGKPGIQALVDALGSEREVAASAARRALWAELDRWEMQPTPTVARNLAILAEALSENVERFGPPARRDAAALAAEILRWLPDSDGGERLEVIAHCDRVFDHTAAERRAAATMAEVAMRQPGQSRSASPAVAEESEPCFMLSPLEPPAMPAVVAAEPGGGLPIDSLPSALTETPPDTAATADRRANASSPGPPSEGPEARPSRLRTPDELFLPEGVRALSANEPLPNAPRPPNLPAAIDDAVAGGPAEPEPDAEFDALEPDVLMRWLQADDPAVAERAEAALRRRGFTDVHLELAHRLFDPDPAVRVELARTVPRLTSVDAVPWLLWLSRDPRTEVRLAAVSLMATTSDPALHARIRQMARDDADAAVQRVARRLDER